MIKPRKSEILFTIVTLSTYFAYLISRLELILLIIPSTILGFGLYFIVKRSGKEIVLALILSIIAIYLTFSYFHFRAASWDGLNLYLKNVLLLKDDFRITPFERTQPPYLTEYFLAIVLKFGSLRALNLVFGIFTVLAVLTTYLMYKSLRLSTFVRNYSILILLSSPSFLFFATEEFKIEMPLLLFANIAYLLFLRYLDNGKTQTAIFLAFILSVASLIKITFIPIAIFLIAICTYTEMKKNHLKLNIIKKPIAMGITFIIPLALWTYFNGIFIKGYLNIAPIYGGKNANGVSLERDKTKLDQCQTDRKKTVFGEFLPNNTLTHKLLQPFFYLTNLNAKFPCFMTHHMANPGIFIYSSVFLLPIGLFIFWRKINTKLKLLYILTLAGSVLFYLYVRTIYWYLFPLFPILATLIPLLTEKTIENAYLKKIIAFIIIAATSLNLLITVLSADLNFEPMKNLNELAHNPEIRKIQLISKTLDAIVGNSLILADTEHQYRAYLTFLPNHDTRVIKSDYYFASSNKSLSGMYAELKSKNVEYLVVDKSMLFDEWYKKCPRENNKILNDFLNTYTYSVYPPDDPIIFKLK